MKSQRTYYVFLSLLFILSCNQEQNESETIVDQALYNTILEQDSILFTKGFNQCDFDIFTSLINLDALEFYDDRSGLNTSKAVEIASVRDRCGENNQSKIKRVLISTEVFPLKGHGAIQLGVHGFYLPNTSEEAIIERAKFVHIWENKNDKWRIKRIVSYDHKN